MIGDLATGYIVTPHSKRSYAALAGVFGSRMNQGGRAPTAVPDALERLMAVPSHHPHTPKSAENRVEPPSDWSEPVELTAVDTSNLWRTSKGSVINPWMKVDRMTGWRLSVRFIEEDGEPVVHFEPFNKQGRLLSGMKPARHMNRPGWLALVEAATSNNPIYFLVRYRYEPMGSD
jgi:hypothetical protein